MASFAQMLGEDEIGLEPEAWRKFDPSLRRVVLELSGDAEIELPVSIALAAPPVAGPAPRGHERERWLAEQERAFDELSAPVRNVIEAEGGYEVRPSWLARALAARLPLRVLEAVALRPEVRQIVLDARRKIGASSEGRHA
jgi:hypothetical protein